MQKMTAKTRWMIRILCASALLFTPLVAMSAQTPVDGTPPSLDLRTAGTDGEELEPTVKTRVYERNLAWWPYTSGPSYGKLERDVKSDKDAIRLAVGSFLVGEGLDIPVELSGTLAAVSEGRAQYFLVKFGGKDPGASRKVIESMGAVVVETLPVNAAVVRLDGTTYNTVAGTPAVTFIEPYHPAYRIHPTVGRMPQATPEKAASPMLSLNLSLFPGEPVAATAELVDKLGVQIDYLGDNEIWLTAPASVVTELARIESVRMITERAPVVPHAQRGALFLQSENAVLGDFPFWFENLDGRGDAGAGIDPVVISVNDSGLSVDAWDFSDTQNDSGWSPGAGADAHDNVVADHRKIAGYITAGEFGGGGDLEACDSLASGAFTHGQVVAGVAAGNGTRGTYPTEWGPDVDQPLLEPGFDGFYLDVDNDGLFSEFIDDGFDGIAKGARVLFVDSASGCPDALSPLLSPGDQSSYLEDVWTNYNATIHNQSYGSAPPAGQPPVYAGNGSELDQATLADPISLVVRSAGNSGEADQGVRDIGLQGNAASCKNCVVVGASSGVGGSGFTFTSTGRGPDDRVLTLLYAEGLDNSCRSQDEDPPGSENQGGPASCEDSGLTQGTSFASPNAAGMAAVVRDYFARGYYPSGSATAADQATISAALVKAVMIGSTKPITSMARAPQNPEQRFNYIWGYGQVFLNRALFVASQPSKSLQGMIVHDVPGNIDDDEFNEGIDGVSNLSLPNTAGISSGLIGSDTFDVLSDEQDLAVTLVWNDPDTSSGANANDLDLEVCYCGADDTCSTNCDDTDETLWKGNVFGEDYDLDGTQESDILSNGTTDGWFYSIPNPPTGTGGEWRDDTNNTEMIIIPTFENSQDLNGDGVKEQGYLREGDPVDPGDPTYPPGKYEIRLFRSAGTDDVNYAVAIQGPVAAGSSVRFDVNPLTCNADVSVIVNETDDIPASEVETKTTVEVVSQDGSTVIDTESTTDSFVKSGLRFESQRFPLSSVSTQADNNGILEVGHLNRLRVTYDDNGTIRQSFADVDCQPELAVTLLRQEGLDSPFILNGGCEQLDGAQDDGYLDGGESFSITFSVANADDIDLVDAKASLRAVDPSTCTLDPSEDPCRTSCSDEPLIDVAKTTNTLGRLNAQTFTRTAFTFSVPEDPDLGLPENQRKPVELVLGVSGPKNGQQTENCIAYEFLLQADKDLFRYLTDCPTGCTLDRDINADEEFEERVSRDDFNPLDFIDAGIQELSVVYGDLTDTTFAGSEACPNCGNDAAGFTGPWDFDSDDEGFTTGVSPLSERAGGSVVTNWGEDTNWDGVLQLEEDQNGNSLLDQSWGTGGGCGFISSDGTNRGIWHTGTIGNWQSSHRTIQCRPDDNICEEYDVQSGTTGEAFWAEFLRTPEVSPVRQGDVDGDGFEWITQIVDWEWNFQVDTGDINAAWTMEFDINTAEGSPTNLGDEFIQSLFSNNNGLVSGGQLDIFDGAITFADTVDDPNASNWGDEFVGSIGNNRTGARGCYFNNLNGIETADGLTAAARPTNTPGGPDDDCDNDYDLGINGCPGACGVDDDGNGFVDDVREICPCKVCETGSPFAGQPCSGIGDCNTAATGRDFSCVSNTDASGVPAGYDDDVCGDGLTDENVVDYGGVPSSVRGIRNGSQALNNGIGGGGRGGGDPRFNTYEDFFPPVGDTWAGEIGFIVYEAEGDTLPVPSYGLGVDDMVLEWKEWKPVPQTTLNQCSTGTDGGQGGTDAVPDPSFDGQCASLSLALQFNTFEGDGELEVNVNDPTALDASDLNVVDCNNDGLQNEVQITAFSEAELLGEEFCLERSSPGSTNFSGTIKYTSAVSIVGDGLVFVGYDGNDTPSVTAQYIDQFDGVRPADGLASNRSGADGQPGIAGFDDDNDGVVDNVEELCPIKTELGPGRSPHDPGRRVRFSDDQCGCRFNPIRAATAAAFTPVDIQIVNVDVTDDCAGCDNDGFVDPGEEVDLTIEIRNLSGFPVTNGQVKIGSSSDLIDCVTNDFVEFDRIEPRGNAAGNDFLTLTGFSFVASETASRADLFESLNSEWTMTVRGLGKGGPSSRNGNRQTLGGQVDDDFAVSGTFLRQTFELVHNLDESGFSPAADFTEDFEAYTSDADLRSSWIPYVTGDDTAELDGTRCQTNDPANPQGNNTDPNDFCQLGEGFDNTDEGWHLEGPGAGKCNGVPCPTNGRSVPGGAQSMSNSRPEKAVNSILDDGQTIDHNRMNWVQYVDSFRVTGDPSVEPELEYFTQMSLTDNRLFGQLFPLFAWDAGQVYVCVDQNNNDECDTGEVNTPANGESWDAIRPWFSPSNNFRSNNFINCMYDPSDDGSTEDEFFPNEDDSGPSSTCFPGNELDTCVGDTRADGGFLDIIGETIGSYCWPETGAEGSEIATADALSDGLGRVWIKKIYNLDKYRGRDILLRFHVTPGGLKGIPNTAAVLGEAADSRDDGWYIDDITMRGLASGGSLSIDNTGAGPNNVCENVTECTNVTTRVNVGPGIRNDRNGDPKPAVYCSDTSEVRFCDLDGDGVLDTTNDVSVESPAPGKAFFYNADFTRADSCLGGAIEFLFEDLSLGTVVRDWGTNPSFLYDAQFETTLRVSARCSVSQTCIGTLDVPITNLPAPPPTECFTTNLTLVELVEDQNAEVSWVADSNAACPAIFDLARGDDAQFASETCVGNDLSTPDFTDEDEPASGSAFFYLSRHNGETYNGSSAPGQVGDRDTSTGSCAD